MRRLESRAIGRANSGPVGPGPSGDLDGLAVRSFARVGGVGVGGGGVGAGRVVRGRGSARTPVGPVPRIRTTRRCRGDAAAA